MQACHAQKNEQEVVTSAETCIHKLSQAGSVCEAFLYMS